MPPRRRITQSNNGEHFSILNSMPAKISAAIRQRAARIKLFLCDVDGVLTDGSVLAVP
jgi:hypothetical protein